MRVSFCVFVFCILSSTHALGQSWVDQKISADAFHADVNLAWEVLNESHSGLYRYTDSLYFTEILQKTIQVEDSLPMHQAYFEISNLIQAARDGHTYVLLNAEQDRDLMTQKRFLPFTFKILDDKVFVNQNFSRSEIFRGDQIVAVDGKPVNGLIETLRSYMTTDGFSIAPKDRLLEGQFWWYYGLHFGFKESHHLVVLHKGKRRAYVVESVSYADRNSILHNWRDDRNSTPIHWHMEEDVGYLRVSRFFDMSQRFYSKQLHLAFKYFREHGVKNLVLDIRGNGGGREGFENQLLSYFPNSLCRKYDKVSMRNVRSEHYDVYMHRLSKKVADLLYKTVEFEQRGGEWHRRERFSSSFAEPKYMFNGNVYLLIDGEVFSSAADFAAMAGDYGTRFVLIGEETAGGYQGNTSGYFYELLLPNTGFIVNVPRINFDLNVRNKLHQGGVHPDYPVKTTRQDFLSNTDASLQFALDLIQRDLIGEHEER